MRLNTTHQIESITVHKYQDRYMVYLGETAGSILMSADEAADLHAKFGAVLPARSLAPADRLLRAVKCEREVWGRCAAAKSESDSQIASDDYLKATFELDQAITAMEHEEATP